MEMEIDVKVTPEELFDYIQYIIAKQIENMFGNPVKPSEIVKGYSHKTTSAIGVGKSNKMRYTITKAVPGKIFETTYSSGANQTVVTYRMEPKGNKTHLTYTSKTKVYNGPAQNDDKKSISDFYNKWKTKRSLKKAIRQIRRARG